MLCYRCSIAQYHPMWVSIEDIHFIPSHYCRLFRSNQFPSPSHHPLIYQLGSPTPAPLFSAPNLAAISIASTTFSGTLRNGECDASHRYCVTPSPSVRTICSCTARGSPLSFSQRRYMHGRDRPSLSFQGSCVAGSVKTPAEMCVSLEIHLDCSAGGRSL